MRVPGSSREILLIGSADEDIQAIGDYDGDAQNDLLVGDVNSGNLMILGLGDEGVAAETSYGSAPAGANWLTGSYIRNETGPVSFTYDWLGRTTFISPVWAYSEIWGFFAPVGFDTDTSEGWLYDPVLGYLWTSEEIFPDFIYQPANGFWLQFLWNTRDPRKFYNYTFGFYMTEDDLAI
jgi:hypothetical protein